MNDLLAFANGLKQETGPFSFIALSSPEGQRFLAWMYCYEPGFEAYFAKVALLKAGTLGPSHIAAVPDWVKGENFRVKTSLLSTFRSAMARIQSIVEKQAKVVTSGLGANEVMGFCAWWQKHDKPGRCAFRVVAANPAVRENGAMPMPTFVPGDLFTFYKQTNGDAPPPPHLIGQGWDIMGMLQGNWTWIIGGLIGGAIGAKLYLKNKSREMMANPAASYGTGWGTTLALKSGRFELQPLLSASTRRMLTAKNMKLATKFRVVSDGEDLGEIHKSRGKRRWKAVSAYGPTKFSNDRASLLSWMKHKAATDAVKEAGIPMPQIMANR